MRKIEEVVTVKILLWLAGFSALGISMVLTHLRLEGVFTNDLLLFGGPFFGSVVLLIRVGLMWRKQRDGTYLWNERQRRNAVRDFLVWVVVSMVPIALGLLLRYLRIRIWW